MRAGLSCTAGHRRLRPNYRIPDAIAGISPQPTTILPRRCWVYAYCFIVRDLREQHSLLLLSEHILLERQVRYTSYITFPRVLQYTPCAPASVRQNSDPVRQRGRPWNGCSARSTFNFQPTACQVHTPHAAVKFSIVLFVLAWSTLHYQGYLVLR